MLQLELGTSRAAKVPVAEVAAHHSRPAAISVPVVSLPVGAVAVRVAVASALLLVGVLNLR